MQVEIKPPPACAKWHPGEASQMWMQGKKKRCRVCDRVRGELYRQSIEASKYSKRDLEEDGRYRPFYNTPYGVLPACDWKPPSVSESLSTDSLGLPTQVS